MSKSGKQIFEEYAVGTPHDRFVLIYNNYGVLENVIRSYEHSVFKQIRDEKEYNRKHRSAGIEELGIRVQSGDMPSDHYRKACNDECNDKGRHKNGRF